jgi:hypothetical protein
MLNRSYDFFKHADRDSDEILGDGQEEVNDHVIVFDVLYYTDMVHSPPTEMSAFIAWYEALYPDATTLKSMAMTPKLEELRLGSREDKLAAGKRLLQSTYGGRQG